MSRNLVKFTLYVERSVRQYFAVFILLFLAADSYSAMDREVVTKAGRYESNEAGRKSLKVACPQGMVPTGMGFSREASVQILAKEIHPEDNSVEIEFFRPPSDSKEAHGIMVQAICIGAKVGTLTITWNWGEAASYSQNESGSKVLNADCPLGYSLIQPGYRLTGPDAALLLQGEADEGALDKASLKFFRKKSNSGQSIGIISGVACLRYEPLQECTCSEKTSGL